LIQIGSAKISAIICSISEIDKANYLKPYNYFELLLTEIPKHMEYNNLGIFRENILPWFEKLPVECKNKIYSFYAAINDDFIHISTHIIVCNQN